jgi:hypothetical protein
MKVKIIWNSIVTCAYSNKMYILAYTKVICHLSVNVVKENLLVFENSARRGFLAPLSSEKNVLGPREEICWTTLM